MGIIYPIFIDSGRRASPGASENSTKSLIASLMQHVETTVFFRHPDFERNPLNRYFDEPRVALVNPWDRVNSCAKHRGNDS